MKEIGKIVIAVLIAQIAIIGALLTKDLLVTRAVGRPELVEAFSQRDTSMKKILARLDAVEGKKVSK